MWNLSSNKERVKKQIKTLGCCFLYFLIFSSGPPTAGNKPVDNTLTGQYLLPNPVADINSIPGFLLL